MKTLHEILNFFTSRMIYIHTILYEQLIVFSYITTLKKQTNKQKASYNFCATQKFKQILALQQMFCGKPLDIKFKVDLTLFPDTDQKKKKAKLNLKKLFELPK